MIYFLPRILNTWVDSECILLSLKHLHYYNKMQVRLTSTISQTHWNEDHYNN